MNERGEYRGEVWGVIEHGYVIILNNAFNKMCERGNFSSKSFLSWAEKQGIIDLPAGNRTKTKTKRINGGVSRCIFLKIQDENIDKDGFLAIEEELEDMPFN